MKLKVGLIGCGSIGNIIYKSIINEENSDGFEVVAVFDMRLEEAHKMAGELAVDSFKDFLSLKMDLVVEAASQEAVTKYGVEILESGKDLLVMSVGAFSDEGIFTSIKKAAKRNAKKVYLPSGAIAGIDAIKAVKGLIEEATLTTTKNPESLQGAPFFNTQGKGLDLSKMSEKAIIYEGYAREAVKLFPQNINVAAILSLAGIGFDKTKIKIIADPFTDKNTHEIIVKGYFGTIKTVSENVPSPDNPRTSYLAAISAVQTLKNLSESIVIGT